MRRLRHDEDSAGLPIHRWAQEHDLEREQGVSGAQQETSDWVDELLARRKRTDDLEEDMPVELREFLRKRGPT